MSEIEPLPADYNGQDAKGRFRPGNRLGRGNPNNRRAQKIRNAIIKAVSPREMAEAARALLEQAKAGDRQAFAELCDRIMGRPTQNIDADVAVRRGEPAPVDLTEFSDDELMKFERVFSGQAPQRPALPPAWPAE